LVEVIVVDIYETGEVYADAVAMSPHLLPTRTRSRGFKLVVKSTFNNCRNHIVFMRSMVSGVKINREVGGDRKRNFTQRAQSSAQSLSHNVLSLAPQEVNLTEIRKSILT
jgi:hypothetical protein